MGSEKKKFGYIWADEAVEPRLPEILHEKQPFKNKKTGEIQYISWWELYIDRQKEILAKAILYGIGQTEQKLHIDDWEALPESTALRLLYGPKKE